MARMVFTLFASGIILQGIAGFQQPFMQELVSAAAASYLYLSLTFTGLALLIAAGAVAVAGHGRIKNNRRLQLLAGLLLILVGTSIARTILGVLAMPRPSYLYLDNYLFFIALVTALLLRLERQQKPVLEGVSALLVASAIVFGYVKLEAHLYPGGPNISLVIMILSSLAFHVLGLLVFWRHLPTRGTLKT